MSRSNKSHSAQTECPLPPPHLQGLFHPCSGPMIDATVAFIIQVGKTGKRPYRRGQPGQASSRSCLPREPTCRTTVLNRQMVLEGSVQPEKMPAERTILSATQPRTMSFSSSDLSCHLPHDAGCSLLSLPGKAPCLTGVRMPLSLRTLGSSVGTFPRF